ncbi:sugar phosphate isomerase/epimerase family protein [Lihuaxuella thermophila]|uniref:Xylose isomerase-like TIM barrel n=1 Tax=Lihuaxuella thermophila TaxID=1173111 RepID=A0A1H8DCA6_9BACL|nr:TIM barrel protein [Lihuaxuella thermophila]SEN04902.1 Xylose isomerase-like TIM barrel [Lihuaxuella thermophila]
MLFSNPISATLSLDLHRLHQVRDTGITRVELQLPEDHYTAEEIKEIIDLTGITPVAFRMPKRLGMGTPSFSVDEWKYWLETVDSVLLSDQRQVVCHGATVPLGAIFEYLDQRPTDFNALHDFKTQYVERVISQIQQLEGTLKELGIQLLIENSPMGSDSYFEPGQSAIYPALRTPRHLLQIIEATDAKLCLDTAHARITSNVLTYMHRSRSMFAGATEKEILSSTKSWIDFYTQVKPHVSLIRLSYAVSWGDTPETAHIPFPASAYGELLTFAEQVDNEVCITLAAGQTHEQLTQMLNTLRDLKRS